MMRASLLGTALALATMVLVIVGTLWPNQSALAFAAQEPRFLHSASSPEAAVDNLLHEIGTHNWDRAYSSLANRNEFRENEFVSDLTGDQGSLRTYATLDGFDTYPAHEGPQEAQIRADLRWSTVVGVFHEQRDLRVFRADGTWQVAWPITKEPKVPPQIIPVNYLRWDVIYRGREDDWGAQDVEAPHVRIVAMHPVERAGSVFILGELLNEDVVPAYVTVKATLLGKNGAAIATEDSFDKTIHTLLPKQVAPFRIDFRNAHLSDVDSVHLEPSSSVVAASADPVVAIESQKLNPLPDPSLTGNLVNQSGQVVNVSHVLGTFYDGNGQIVWVADVYPDRALLPQAPVSFSVPLPSDVAGKVSTYRVAVSTYSSSQFR